MHSLLIAAGRIRRPRSWAASHFVWIAAVAVGFAGASPELPAGEVASAPPEFSDAEHVPQGCYVSTVAYLSRFLTTHPDESGEPLTVVLPCFNGPHTIAVVTWRGRWWGRDEYSGVFEIGRAVTATRDVDGLRGLAAQALTKVTQRQLKNGRIRADTDRDATVPLSRRRAAVFTAARLLPCAAQVYTVVSGRNQVPLLYFRSFAGRVAVYDPASGTATAVCEPTDERELVAAIATRLGYDVSSIRLEPTGNEVAATTPLPDSGGG